MDEKEKKIRNILLGVTFVELLGFGILLPLLPFLALEVHATPFEIGCLAASFPLFQMICMPFWGHAADRWGTRTILLISLLGTTLAFLLFALSTHYWIMILSRALAGATSATLGVARGALTHPMDKESTQKNMRLFGAAQGLGVLLGPIIGAIFQVISLNAPIWVAFFVNAMVTIALYKQKDLPKQVPAENMTIANKFRKISRNRKLLIYSATYFFIYLAFAFLFISFPLFVKQIYNYGPKESTIYFSILSLCAALTQIVLLPLVQKKVSNQWLLKLLMLSFSFGIIWLAVPSTGIQTGVVLALVSCVLFLAIPVVMTEIGVQSQEDEKQFVAGFTESLSGFARLGGTALSGALIQNLAVSSAFHTSAIMAFIGFLTLFFVGN